MTDIKTVVVIGAGAMGNGIAQTAAISGYDVVMIDTIPAQLEKAIATIKKSTDKLHSKDKITSAQRAAAQSIETGTDMSVAKDADLVIEAIPEVLSIKQEVFSKLDEIARSDAILATNTSSISITAIAAAAQRPARVIGMHFL